jgi:hypothetical protein
MQFSTPQKKCATLQFDRNAAFTGRHGPCNLASFTLLCGQMRKPTLIQPCQNNFKEFSSLSDGD